MSESSGIVDIPKNYCEKNGNKCSFYTVVQELSCSGNIQLLDYCLHHKKVIGENWVICIKPDFIA